MTAPSRGRGRPVTFDDTAQDAFLALVADGIRVGDAADKLGVNRRTPNHLAARDRQFARRLATAKDEGAEARAAAPKELVHGRASTYNHHKCRCTPCTTAATRTRSNAPDRKHADIHHLPPPQPPAAETKFVVLADVV